MSDYLNECYVFKRDYYCLSKFCGILVKIATHMEMHVTEKTWVIL